MNKPTCRHCGRPRVNRPRGLCWTCYYAPGIREQYVSTHPHAARGVGNQNSRKTPKPTTARRGTPEKVAVMAARAARGEAIFHEHDA